MRNWFKELSEINVSDHIEKKNGLSYLSWAWAWNEFKKRFPLSYTTVYTNETTGENFFRDPVGAHVKTGVTIVWEEDDGTQHDLEAIEMLPIIDFRNKPVPAENIDCMQLNKTIQRSLTKAIARHGLGLYIYAGEDMPEESEEVKKARAETIKKIDAAMKKLAAGMDTAQKTKLFNETVVPIIGGMNYKTCDDLDKLQTLLSKIEQKEAA